MFLSGLYGFQQGSQRVAGGFDNKGSGDCSRFPKGHKSRIPTLEQVNSI